MKKALSGGERYLAGLESTALSKSAVAGIAFKTAVVANRFLFPLYSSTEDNLGITRPEAVSLYCLFHYAPLTAQDISDIAYIPKTSISRGVKLLMDRGYAEGTQDPDDGRRTELVLTSAGKEAFGRLSESLLRHSHAVFGSLSDLEREIFESILIKVLASDYKEPER